MFKIKKESFPKREEEILSFWQKEKIFEKSLEKNKKKLFSFYDGPPFATGLPHYGHLLAGTIKDVIPRYKTMKGFFVPRRFGWDCHGLPVENEIEKEEKLYGAKSIEEYGIARFNEHCKQIVLRYTKEWEKTVLRMGRWVDFQNTYRTMDLSFMESVWWVFKQLFDKGLVYQGFKVMPFSTKLGTPLSNFEANLNYKEVNDPSLTVAFQSREEPKTYFLAWTTTPWTLVSNLALTVGSEIFYVKVQDLKSLKIYYLAKERLNFYFPHEERKILAEMQGKDLVGKTYEPLFPFFASKKEEKAFRLISGDFVTLEEGTGIVHTAPAFGEDDFYVCQRENIKLVCPIDQNGLFTEEVAPLVGIHVKEADPWVIQELKAKQALFHEGKIRHRYPFCWRSDTPLIYKAVETWFVAVEKIKNQLIEANQKIFWVPDHIKEGRFGKWLENARDWAISRNRYWGTPIPIWQSEDFSKENIVFGSIKELEKKTKTKIIDLHRQYLDGLTFTQNKKVYRRVSEVFDCWFESGAMPYAQNHYPFENKKFTEKSFPADFIGEGLDQTRGWFYTLNVLSTALFNQPAFKHVIVNGIILAADGNKMSKRLKNYPDPDEVIQKYGADAIRLFMLHSPAVTAEDFRFSTEGVELVTRQVLLPLWNSYVFLATYAAIYHFDPKTLLPKKPKNELDQWVLSLLQKLIVEVESQLEAYELSKALDPLFSFIDQLTNWYIRRSRLRFWQDEATQDREEAFATLYHVLKTLAKVAAPFIPFLSEAIYQELRQNDEPLSLHLLDWPKIEKSRRKEKIEQEMDIVQRVVTLGHALRKEHRLKVRQPLAKAFLVAASPEIIKIFKSNKNLIMEELNVKSLEFHEEEEKFIQLVAKPNFPVLGKKIGKNLPRVQKMLSEWTQKEMKEFLEKQKASISLDQETIELDSFDVIIERKVLENLAAHADEKIAIALDTKLTEELILEGVARELVNKINLMRKEKDFHVSDRICVQILETPLLKKAIDRHRELIQHEVLALSIDFEKNPGEEIVVNEEKTQIMIKKA